MNKEIDYTIIKKYRKEMKLTQKALGDKVGVSSAYIQQLENGIKTNPSLEVVLKLSSTLSIPNKYLMKEDFIEENELHETILKHSPVMLETDSEFRCLNIKLEDFKNNKESQEKLIRNLIGDLMKAILIKEEIPPENFSFRDYLELKELIIETIKIKNNIANLNI